MTKKSGSFREALEAFEDLECKFGLSAWTVNDVYLWKLVRRSFFSDYRQHLGLPKAAHPEKQRLKKSRVRVAFSFPKLFVFQNPFFIARDRCERIVIPHARKVFYDGRLVDPISYAAWRPPYDKTATILDNSDSLNPSLLANASSFEVLVRLAWVRGQTYQTRLKSQDRKIISGLSQALFHEKYSPELELQIIRSVKAFIGLKRVFTAFLKRTQPNYIYIVCSYGLEALIAAAQDFGVEVVEFQHGSVGRGHLGYDFKGWGAVPYFPDRMLAFGNNWFREAYFPENCMIDSVGYASLEDTISEAKGRIERQPKQLLVLSQGPIADQVLAHASSFAAQRLDWQVVIRPHPSENADDLQQQMTTMSVTDNWRVEKECSLQEHTAASAVVFGVNSTALIEALLAGCRVALLDAGNSPSYFDSLTIGGHARKVRDGGELAEVVDDLPVGSARGYFAEPVVDIVSHVEVPAV